MKLWYTLLPEILIDQVEQELGHIIRDLANGRPDTTERLTKLHRFLKLQLGQHNNKGSNNGA
jgi:hypothetical protein